MRTLYFIIRKFFQMAFNDFTLLLCPINTGGHWEIAFAFPQTKKLFTSTLLENDTATLQNS
jgi:hypothetical protein